MSRNALCNRLWCHQQNVSRGSKTWNWYARIIFISPFMGGFHVILHSIQDGCWWPGGARNQGFYSHGIALVLLEYISYSTRKFNAKIRIRPSHGWPYEDCFCKKKVSMLGTSSCIPWYLHDVINCSCPWYLLPAQHSWYKEDIDRSIAFAEWSCCLQSIHTTRISCHSFYLLTLVMALCRQSKLLTQIYVTVWHN